MHTLIGRCFIGVFDQKVPWDAFPNRISRGANKTVLQTKRKMISDADPAGGDIQKHPIFKPVQKYIPGDVRRVASSNTLKVRVCLQTM